MRRRSFLSALGASSGAIVLGSSRSAAAANPALSSTDLNAIRSSIQSYFNNRADLITEAGRSLPGPIWRQSATAAFGRSIDNDVPALFDGRELATTAHGGYTRAETSVALSVLSAASDELTVGVEELTALYFAGRHPAGKPATRYRLDHRVHLIRSAPNQWSLAGATVVSDGALPPLTQPHLDRAGRSRASTPAFESTGPASTTDRQRPRPDRVLAGRYRYADMVRYASSWALGRNPSFPNYHDNGGDCTNFVSQIMLAGGWETVGPPGQSTRSKWFYGPTFDDCSFTWGAANNFHSFALTYSGRMKLVDDVYWCQDADVVQYDWTADNNIDHTQFVSDNVYDEQTVELYMTQHDNDYIDRPISEILADLNRTYPNYQTFGMTHVV